VIGIISISSKLLKTLGLLAVLLDLAKQRLKNRKEKSNFNPYNFSIINILWHTSEHLYKRFQSPKHLNIFLKMNENNLYSFISLF